MDKSGFVILLREPKGKYLITNAITGESKRAQERLEISYNTPLQFIHLIPTDNRIRLFNELCQRFSGRRLRYGWFALTGDDVEIVISMGRITYESQEIAYG